MKKTRKHYTADGKVNERNGWMPRDFRLEEWQKQAIVNFYLTRHAPRHLGRAAYPQTSSKFCRPTKVEASRRRLEVMATCGRQNCRVLVVDDSEDIARLIRSYSEGEPIEVLVVATAEEGLEKLKEAVFDLVLMDFHLPGMDGASGVLSMRLMERQLKRRPLPVFAMTDLLDRDSGEQMLRAGCTALLGKPLSRQQFLTIASRGRKRTLEIEPEKEAEAKPLRILVAEDSADNRMLLQVFLSGSVHRLTFAGNGQIAVDRFAAESFDLVLMDMNMPIMDGLTATRAMRAVEQKRGTVPIPIVALTGNQGPQDVALSGAAGCDQHLSKPISKRQLLEAIENTVR